MISFFKKYWPIFSIFAVALAIYWQSLFVFYTNDDFFFLKIAKAENLRQFISFFSLAKGPDGFGMYRPLTTQVFYFFGREVFDMNPIYLHVISFIFFFGIIFLVYKLAQKLTESAKIGLISALLYAVSATHFPHLYYLATFQELGMTFFVLLAVLAFISFAESGKVKFYTAFLFTFLLAIASKETAVVTPFLTGIAYWYLKSKKVKVIPAGKFLLWMVVPLLVLAVYFGFRFYSYGFAMGDTYIWDFSLRKLINTTFWYMIWSLNLPETLLDFVGPGLKLNPNIFVYWSKQMIPIFVLFGIECLGLIAILFKSILVKDIKIRNEGSRLSAFAIFWFLVALLPVILLPQHKFTIYLTLPLVGVALRIGYLLARSGVNNAFMGAFIAVWTVMSILTVKHSYNTNWITQGELIAQRTQEFFNKNADKTQGKEIVFADSVDDMDLPWSPTLLVKTALGGDNFFAVYYPGLSGKIHYGYTGKVPAEKSFMVISRSLLGY